jgi:hypothetical protein
MLGFAEAAEQRAYEIRKMILSLPFKITFSTSISVKSATNGRILDYLSEAGLEQLCVGFESVDEMQLKRYGKQQTLEENYMAADEITRRGIPILPGLITFDPFATKDTISKNLNFLFDKLHHYNIGKLTKRLHVLTGTPIVEMVRRAGLLTGDYLYYDYNFQNQDVELLYRKFQEYSKMVQGIQKRVDRGSLQLQKLIGQYHKNVAIKILEGVEWKEYAILQIKTIEKILEEVKK